MSLATPPPENAPEHGPESFQKLSDSALLRIAGLAQIAVEEWIEQRRQLLAELRARDIKLRVISDSTGLSVGRVSEIARARRKSRPSEQRRVTL